MGGSQGDGGAGHRASRAPFDPVAGVRAMADVQAEGLRAAGELLERMLRREPDGSGPPPAAPAGEITALVDAWTDLLRRTVAGLTAPGRPEAITVAVDATGVGPRVRLTRPGSGDPEGAVAEVWLHNASSSAVGPVALRCGPLSDCDATALEDADVRFEPREVEVLPARSSRAVLVSLAADRPLRPGTYRGTIQARGAPGLWLPFEVVVESC